MKSLYYSIVGFLFVVFFSPVSSYSQIALDDITGVELMNSIDIEVQTDLSIVFSVGISSYTVQPGDMENSVEVLIRGSSSEVMVDLEQENLNAMDSEDNSVFKMSNFNVAETGAGTSTTLTPSSEDMLYSFFIGGSVTGMEDVDEYYTGVNVLNVNYF